MKPFLTLIINVIFLLYASTTAEASQNNSRALETLVFSMPEKLGSELVEQCTRTAYYPESFWRVDLKQIDAIEGRLRRHIEKLKAENYTGFLPQSLDQYKRQYIGFEMDGESYYYGNFFPRKYDLDVDPWREPVVYCRSDQRFWGVLFNLDQFEFVSIERNDKLIKLKGPINPFRDDVPEQ